MKLSIELKSADSQGRQKLLLTRHYGTSINQQGKREQRRKRQSLDLYIYQNPKDKSQRDHNRKTLVVHSKANNGLIVYPNSS